jgi:hypothetical protein
LAILASQIEQYMFRNKTAQVLSALQSIQLRITTWQEAQEKLRPRLNDRKDSEVCNEHACTTALTLTESVFGFLSSRNIFVRLDDYFRWKLRLTYNMGPFERLSQFLLPIYVHLGGRPARVVATLEIRDGVVWSKGFFLGVESYSKESGFPFSSYGGDYSLFVDARPVSRFRLYGDGWPEPDLLLHPDYSIGAPSGCEICVGGWVKFTPYAEPSDVSRFLDMNLSCLTRWTPCRTQEDRDAERVASTCQGTRGIAANRNPFDLQTFRGSDFGTRQLAELSRRGYSS